MRTATYRRYVDDPTTTEQELHRRSGQRVTVASTIPIDADEVSAMHEIEFEDGYRDVAFSDELTDWGNAS